MSTERTTSRGGGTGELRRNRLAAGLSQEKLARMADCSTAYVRLLEAGYQPRDSSVLPRVRQALKDAS